MPDARSYEAKELVCRECDEWFVCTANEQRFYAEQGYPPSKRCSLMNDVKDDVSCKWRG